jgi:hypothetical protein
MKVATSSQLTRLEWADFGFIHTLGVGATHKFKVVQDYLMTQGVDPSQHTVATTFPRVVISDGEKTLGELGLAPQMSLSVEPQ